MLRRADRERDPSPSFHLGRADAVSRPGAGLSAHRNAVAVLCAGVDAPFEVARDPRRPAEGTVACRTTLIPANSLHHLHCGDTLMAFLYVDAQSDDYRCLAASMAMRSAVRHAACKRSALSRGSCCVTRGQAMAGCAGRRHIGSRPRRPAPCGCTHRRDAQVVARASGPTARPRSGRTTREALPWPDPSAE